MTNQQYKKVLHLLKTCREIKTWTSEKNNILLKVLTIMTSGPHEIFTSHSRIHGKYVGLFYLNDNAHKRRGTLQKFRGNNIMVLCNKSGLGQSRTYIVSTIDGQIDIRKTNHTKVSQGLDISLQSLPLISLDSLPPFHSKVYH
jgi:hypothetical protein